MQMQVSKTYRNPHHETLSPKATKNDTKYGSSSVFAQNKQMISDAIKSGGAQKRHELTAPSARGTPMSSPGRDEEDGSYLEITEP